MAKFCTNCGATIPDEKYFCTECGTRIGATEEAPVTPPPVQTPPPTQAPPPPPTQAPPPNYQYQTTAATGEAVPAPGSRYEPITTGGYIGIMLLMCIPIIGFLLTIIWACGGCRKLQKRNLARASLIMMVIGLVISLILGVAMRGVFRQAAEKAGITSDENLGSIVGGLLRGEEGGSNNRGILGFGGNGSTGNSDLDALQGLMNQLEGLTGQEMGGEELFSEIGEINAEASQNSDGWPSDLPDFPSGSMNAVEDYRTEFSGTTLEDTKAYIETLKGMGYEYQDFYDFGMSEADMMEYGGWWGYNGKWYISISYAEGTTTIDHVTELPDLSELLG